MSVLARMLEVLSYALASFGRLLASGARGLAALAVGLILIFEEWGWRPLAELLALLARFRLWARLEAVISRLSPYPALIVFALPSAILLPVKLGALYLLGQGQILLAGALLVAAKLVSTALVARIFMLTRPALMQLGWFARLYHWIMPWKDALFIRIRASWAWRYGRMVKHRVLHEARRAWQAWRPKLQAWRVRARNMLAPWRLSMHLLVRRGWRWLRLFKL